MTNAAIIAQTAFTGADGNEYTVDLTSAGTAVIWPTEGYEPLAEFVVSAIPARIVMLGVDRYLDDVDYACIQRLARLI
jgi:hypothetical protein